MSSFPIGLVLDKGPIAQLSRLGLRDDLTLPPDPPSSLRCPRSRYGTPREIRCLRQVLVDGIVKSCPATVREPPLKFSSDGSKFPSSLSLAQLEPDASSGGHMSAEIQVRVNGKSYETQVEPRLLLVHYLRDVLGLTGTHVGCETSLCGACTIFLDGQVVKSCTVLAVQADSAEITTIEGLVKNGELHPMQEGFWERHGL